MFSKIQMKQIIAAIQYPQHSKWFSTLPVIIFGVNIVAERKQTYW